MNLNYNVSTLFSSLNTGSTSGTSGLSSVLSDYGAIRNGSYGKLLKAYYNNVDNSAVKSTYNSAVKNGSTRGITCIARVTLIPRRRRPEWSCRISRS